MMPKNNNIFKKIKISENKKNKKSHPRYNIPLKPIIHILNFNNYYVKL